MSLAKLTSISTKTLSLLLERQRLQTLPSFNNSGPLGDSSSPNANGSGNSLHLPQIKKNLAALRSGIKEMEAKEGGRSEAAVLLRNQYERMRGMLGDDAEGIPLLEDSTPKSNEVPLSSSSMSTPQSSYATPLARSPAPMPSVGLTASRGVSKQDSARFISSTSSSSSTPPPQSLHSHSRGDSENPIFQPYSDDPSSSAAQIPLTGTGLRRGASPNGEYEVEDDTNTLLQSQRFIMDEQDQRLDQLSHSINRQHHISLQINDELDVHTGLLEDLEAGVDGVDSRLGTARRKLDRVARGIKENSSVFAIGVLIFVLLVLIIVLKT